MPDIKHAIQIDASAESILPLISTAAGFSKWWAKDSVEEPDGAVELGFFNRSTIYKLHPENKSSSEVTWRCETGKEWQGTAVRFELSPSGTGTQLRFFHAGWQNETDYFTSCN